MFRATGGACQGDLRVAGTCACIISKSPCDLRRLPLLCCVWRSRDVFWQAADLSVVFTTPKTNVRQLSSCG